MAEAAQEPDEIEAVDENLTAMQLAFRRAQQSAQRERRLDKKTQTNRQAQEDLLSRTLANKRK
jgi:hypothetical protein